MVHQIKGCKLLKPVVINEKIEFTWEKLIPWHIPG